MEEHELVLSDVHLSIPYIILPSECHIYKDVIPNYSDNLVLSEREKLAVSRLRILFKRQDYDFGLKHKHYNLQLIRKGAQSRVDTDSDAKYMHHTNAPVDEVKEFFARPNQSCFGHEKAIFYPNPINKDENVHFENEDSQNCLKTDRDLLTERKETLSGDSKNHLVLKQKDKNLIVTRGASLMENKGDSLEVVKKQIFCSEDGTVLGPDTTVLGPDTTVLGPDTSKESEDRTVLGPDTSKESEDGTVLGPDTSKESEDGTVLGPDTTVLGPDTSKESEDGTVLGPDTTVLGPDTSKESNLTFSLDRRELSSDQVIKAQPDHQPAIHEVLHVNLLVDDDGDYDVKRRKISENQEEKTTDSASGRNDSTSCKKDTLEVPDQTDSDVSYITIVHHLATQRDDVGQQVWQGALLLCEYILSHQEVFTGRVVIDLGTGVGLTSAITGIFAKRVFSTDLHTSILRLAEYNIQSNLEVLGRVSGVARVRKLDWMTDWRQNSLTSTLSPGLSDEYSWTDADIQELDNLHILIAADVVYDEDLTEGFFRTFHHFMSKPPSKTLYMGLEKRLIFTMIEQDICCPAYSHFRECLEDLSRCTDNGLQYNVEQLSTDFPRCFQYRRIPQLELWKISTAFSLFDET